MSKSLGNYIGITDAPDDMFGKVMSVSDDLMWRYFELLSFRSAQDVAALRRQVDEGGNPRDVKFLLAEELIGRFHDQAAATAARENFIARFQRGAMPEDMPEATLPAPGGQLRVANLLKDAGLVSSTSEALRMIKQGAVKIDGERLEDTSLECKAGETHVYQVGKRRFARVTLS
jgi:tyrosyl-tRNA synthetase